MKRSITFTYYLMMASFLLFFVAFGLVYLSLLAELNKTLLFLVFFLLALQAVAIILVVLFICFAPINEDDETKTH